MQQLKINKKVLNEYLKIIYLEYDKEVISFLTKLDEEVN